MQCTAEGSDQISEFMNCRFEPRFMVYVEWYRYVRRFKSSPSHLITFKYLSYIRNYSSVMNEYTHVVVSTMHSVVVRTN